MIKKDVFIYRNKNHKGCIGVISNVNSNDIEVNILNEDFYHINTISGMLTIKKDYCSIE